MPIFKNAQEIFDKPWQVGQQQHDLPLREEWLSAEDPKFFHVELWEQIYFQPGNIAVYAAWSPFVEIYTIRHNLFQHTEIYYSSAETVERLRDFDITLPETVLWI